MHGAALRLFRTLLPACVPVLAGAAPLPAQGAAPDTFVLLVGGDTLGVETYTRTAERLEGELALRTPPLRQRFEAALTPDALMPRVEYSARIGSAAPLATGVVEFRGDSAIARVRATGVAPEQRFAPGSGALPYLNPSPAFLEQIALRARVLGGDSVRVPLLSIQSGQAFAASVVRRGGDTLLVTLPPGVEIRLVTDGEGRVVGGCVPAQNVAIRRVGSPPVACAGPPADYSAPPGAPYRAEEVRVRAPDGVELAGTLTLPTGVQGRVPAVLLLTGSGAQDRDEAIPGMEGYRPFRQIADTLSRRGIAVLRLDDRGIGGSGGSLSSTPLAAFAADARAAVAFLRARPEVDARRVAIVGHSEGAYVGPMVAASDTALRALALLAAPSRPGRALVDYQQRYGIESDSTIPVAERDSVLRASDTAMDSMAASSAWLRSLLEHDPVPVARRLRAPVLILQGATDRQVPAAQAEELAAAIRAGGNRRVTVRVFPGINHLFLPDPGGDPRGYTALPVREVPREVLGTLADWLAARLR